MDDLHVRGIADWRANGFLCRRLFPKNKAMSILNDIWNRIARRTDRHKAPATEAAGTENRVYAVATEEGVMLFSDTPKGMKARNSYLQHLADGFFNVAKVPETLRIYEMDLPTKRVAELADRRGVSMTEISLAWLLTKVTAPVVGATKLHHIEGAAKAVDLELTDEEWSALPARAPDVTTEDRHVLRAALSVLSEQERQVVMLHAVTGLKHREIAQLLELPLATVLSKYRRALKKLNLLLEGDDA